MSAHLQRQVIYLNLADMETIIENYQFSIFKYCFQMLRSKETSEDITQEVFLTYFRLSGKKENVPQYLYAIAHSRCIDNLRREKRKRLFVKNFSHEAYEEAAEDSFFRNEYSYELQAALDTLTDYERSVLLLKSVSELSFREISEILKRKEPALRKQFQRAKSKIEKKINWEGAKSNDEGIPVL